MGSSPQPPVSIRRTPPHHVPWRRQLAPPPTATPPQWHPQDDAPATVHAQGRPRNERPVNGARRFHGMAGANALRVKALGATTAEPREQRGGRPGPSLPLADSTPAERGTFLRAGPRARVATSPAFSRGQPPSSAAIDSLGPRWPTGYRSGRRRRRVRYKRRPRQCVRLMRPRPLQ